MSDILQTLRDMERKQGEDYVWRTAKAAADEIERLRAALDEVVNPLKYMEQRAKAKGHRLNSSAYGICNNLAFVQQIAREALRDTP